MTPFVRTHHAAAHDGHEGARAPPRAGWSRAFADRVAADPGIRPVSSRASAGVT